jgi:nucleoside-diphosphate-sugar epimerase
VRTLIIGCGYLGTRVGAKLLENGDRVIGTTRSEEQAARLARRGIEPVIHDVATILKPGALPSAERVVYCVGFDRAGGESRRSVVVEGLSNTLGLLDLRVLVSLVFVSTTSVYGDHGGGWVDESSPAAPEGESGQAALEAEDRVGEFVRSTVVSSVNLRLAGIYGPGRVIGRSMLERREAFAGDPARWLNLIHVDDAAEAVVSGLAPPRVDARAVEAELVLVADDRPWPREAYYRYVAAACGLPAPVFEPSRDTDRQGNKRVRNDRMKQRLGVNLQYKDLTDGLVAVLAEEGSEGTGGKA